jgi:enoyl-CoA hydratase/carnithine racemase
VVFLPARLPAGLAAQMIYSGDPISAVEAERCGFVTRLAPDDALEQVADELAQRIARHSAAALRAAKRALRGPGADVRRAALGQAEHAYLHDLMDTHDALEGLRAFAEKRQPAWSHA